MSYSISSGALGSPDLLLSFPLIALALHNTTTLIITHLSFQSRNQYKSINQLLKVRSHPVSLLDSLLVSPLDNLLANLPDNLQHSPQVSQLVSPLVNLRASRLVSQQGTLPHSPRGPLLDNQVVGLLPNLPDNLQHSPQVSQLVSPLVNLRASRLVSQQGTLPHSPRGPLLDNQVVGLLPNLPDNLQHSPRGLPLLSPLVNLQGSRPHILQGSRLHNRQVSLQASLLVSRLHDRQGNLQHSLQVSPPVLLASLQVSPLASLHADQHPIRQLRHRYRKVSFTFKRLFLLLYIGIFPSLLLSNM